MRKMISNLSCKIQKYPLSSCGRVIQSRTEARADVKMQKSTEKREQGDNFF